MGERFVFEDVWQIQAPREVAWRMVDDVAGWPHWWPDYRLAECVSQVRHGTGSRWHVRVKADLPYTLDFHFTVVEHRPPSYVKTSVEGFFTGEIDWKLEADAEKATRMLLRERTETKWPIINLVARIGGRRLLERNHKGAMDRGEAGMRAALAAGYRPPNLDAG
ncbi:MAG TPA: SRPBCC family protein [Candidatus Dormibacteraeota bacterium]|nr:SRPBCC family protein [Candidatus Dormibacteraeota bacterium]